MLEAAAVNQLAREVATRTLGRDVISRVDAEPIADSEGRDALRIFVTLKDDYRDKIPEGGSSRILLALSDALIDKGDERFPFVEYATESELAADAGSES